MSRVTEKIIGGLLGLFLLVTVGYQAYLALRGTMKTETVYDYVMSRSIPVEGIAIRSETVVPNNFTGIENCIFEDGERVTIGENIAEFYDSHQSDTNLRRTRELEAEIAMLEEAQGARVNIFINSETLNQGIKEQIGYLTKMSESARFSSSNDVRTKITALINKKQISTGKADNFDSRVSELKEEYQRLQSQSAANAVMYATAPATGFFSSYIDGYENKLSPEIIKDYDTSDLLNIIDTKSDNDNINAIGKIVTHQNWLFACAVQKSDIEFVSPGQEVGLNFEVVSRDVPATVMDILQDKNQERAVLVLMSNHVSDSLLDFRHSDAIIHFNQYMGLRIDAKDIRFQGEKMGVYILDNNTVKFRFVDPIYEDQSFILSRMIPPDTLDAGDKEYVALFDQIITKGHDLYDGKVIQ